MKIYETSVLVAIKMETGKRMQNNIETYRKMLKIDPKMGAHTRSFFSHLAFFFLGQTALGGQMASKPPQELPRPVRASISIDFLLILDDLLMVFCVMWVTFYLVCFITYLVTSSFHF